MYLSKIIYSKIFNDQHSSDFPGKCHDSILTQKDLDKLTDCCKIWTMDPQGILQAISFWSYTPALFWSWQRKK